MIKIAITDELSNLMNVYKHPLLNSGIALELKEKIYVSKKQDEHIIPATYYLDNKNNMHVIVKMVVDDPYSDGDEPPADEYEIKFSSELKPMTYAIDDDEKRPFNLVNLIECIYKHNSDKLSEKQKELLYKFFKTLYPMVLEDNESDSIRTVFPNTHISPVDKVSNKTFEGAIMFNDPLQVDVGRKPNKVLVDVALEFNNIENIKGIERFNEYDHAVHDGICTLWEAGNQYITPRMIYHVMTGSSETKITENHFNKITESIEKLRRVMIIIDATEEARRYNNLKQVKFNGYAVAAIGVEAITLNNETVSGYKLLAAPILLTYAKAKNQIASIPIQLLATPINKTDEVILLQNYLRKRIATMKNKNNNMSNVILFETIYKQIEMNLRQSFTKQKKAKIREHCKTVLDFWKQEKFITHYKEIKKSGSFYSIEIFI